MGCYRYSNGMRGDHLLGEDFLCKDLLDLVHAGISNGDLHSQGLAHQVANGVHLVGMEMDGHEEQHLAEGSRETRRPFEVGLLKDQPFDPFDSFSFSLWSRCQGVACYQDAQTKGNEFHSSRCDWWLAGDQVKQRCYFFFRQPETTLS